MGLMSKVKATVPSWHVGDGTFKNNYLPIFDASYVDLYKAFRDPKPPLLEFPLAPNQSKRLKENREQPTLTWIGHCTLLLQIAGLNILTDPVFSQRASPFTFLGPERGTPPGLKIEELPPIDIILISHNHYDHLDSWSIKQLLLHSPQAQVMVPLKLKNWFKGMSFANVYEHDWWEERQIDKVLITAVPSQHWSNRGFDRNETLWCAWTIHTDNFSFIFIGDTGYSDDFKDIHSRLGSFDLAAIPIGAYNPRWFMKNHHQNPEEAVQCMLDLGAKKAVATHWGTFLLTLEPMEEPPQLLSKALVEKGKTDDDFLVLQHGQTIDL